MKEILAELCHNQWSGWVRYMFSKGTFNGTWTMPAWAAERWKRQMETPYAELSESEQNSDRTEADKFLLVFLHQLNNAFDKAEQDTAQQYNSQTCSLEDVDGNQTCPICFFRQKVKGYLELKEG
jgi:hypothetical protein